ncbi:MAG: ABC transporter permease [Rhodothermales bacterium]
MKQTFTDIPASSRFWRVVQLWRQGWFSLAAGSIILSSLLLGNVVAFVNEEPLQRQDAAYRQPPHWPFLQRLLFQAPIAIEPYSQSSDFDTLLGIQDADTDSQKNHPPSLIITSRPSFTATAHRPYRYQLRVQHPAGTLRYKLITAPPGMEIDAAGLIQWTPEAQEANGRGVEVKVAAIGTNGTGSQQSFSIIVSEHVHPLGTDEAGRDIGAALILGTRWTLLPGLLAVAVSMLLGVLIGGLAGYYEGRIDAALSYVATLFESFPALVILFLAAVIFRYNLYAVMVVLGLILFPGVAREVKARVTTLKAQQFVEASRELGLSDAEILWKDIVWYNARPVLLARMFHGFALAVMVEVTLSYLNIGILPPTVSWGTMILAGRGLIESHQYWLAFFPALATGMSVAGFYLLGQGLGHRLRARKT